MRTSSLFAADIPLFDVVVIAVRFLGVVLRPNLLLAEAGCLGPDGGSTASVSVNEGILVRPPTEVTEAGVVARFPLEVAGLLVKVAERGSSAASSPFIRFVGLFTVRAKEGKEK